MKKSSTKKQNAKPVTIIAKNKAHLKILIYEAIAEFGPKCDLNFIDVSKVKDMSELFNGSVFNGDISNWNVSNVVDMHQMFMDSKFNGDISKWDVSNVKDMSGLFSQPLKSHLANAI